MMLRGNFIFCSLSKSLSSVFKKKKNLSRKIKEKKTTVGLSTRLSVGCLSELIDPDGNWYDQNSVPFTLEYTWNILKPT